MNNLKIKIISTTLVIAVISIVNISEAISKSNTLLNSRQKAIVPIAAFTASGNMQKLETSFNEGLDAGLTVNEIKEILIHSYAYAGFPRALNGINCFLTVLDDG